MPSTQSGSSPPATTALLPAARRWDRWSARTHEVFACLSGTIVEETDKAVWDKHWNKHAAAWFPDGREDPNVMMLRFDIADAEVWTVDPTLAGKFKLMTGRPIEPKDVGEYATGAV
ncbi:MAG: pyridoxamine 5'-phosphate oxidase family protein [Sphingomonadaceae bacterium]